MITSNDTVRFAPLIKDQDRILGGLFTFRGLHVFLCLLESGPGTGGLAFSHDIDPEWRALSVLRPFDRMDYMPIPQFAAHEVVFNWGTQRPTLNPPVFSHQDLLNAVSTHLANVAKKPVPTGRSRWG